MYDLVPAQGSVTGQCHRAVPQGGVTGRCHRAVSRVAVSQMSGVPMTDLLQGHGRHGIRA